jgi:hypothetical protein
VTKYSPILLYWGHNLDVKKTIKKEARDSDQGVIHSFIQFLQLLQQQQRFHLAPSVTPMWFLCIAPVVGCLCFLPQGSSAGSRLVPLQRSFETGTHFNDASILGRS